jgi:hypothetical protein
VHPFCTNFADFSVPTLWQRLSSSAKLAAEVPSPVRLWSPKSSTIELEQQGSQPCAKLCPVYAFLPILTRVSYQISNLRALNMVSNFKSPPGTIELYTQRWTSELFNRPAYPVCHSYVVGRRKQLIQH